MRATSSHLFLSLCVLLWASLSVPARADVALGAKTVTVPGVKMQGVQSQIGEDGQGGLKLTLKAAKADVPSMGWKRLPP